MTRRLTPDILLAPFPPCGGFRRRVCVDMNFAPDYEELEHALHAARVELSAAEMHGMVTAAASFPEPPLLSRLFFDQRGAPSTAQADQLLALGETLQEDVRRRLEETEFEFEPMLGEAPVADRIERLAAWSRGYVLGLTAGGLRDPAKLAGNAGEFLTDAIQIGEAEMDEDDD